jgi:alpha-tubulin suppressor-like RCC1 family protein
VLKNDGTVWAWGYNGSGQLGDGTTTARTLPVRVSGLTGVTAISANLSNSLALLGNGTLYSWGSNFFGQLGDGTFTNRNTPVQVQGLTQVVSFSFGGTHSIAALSNGTVWTWGEFNWGQLGDGNTVNARRTVPGRVMGLTSGVSVDAGYSASNALRGDGTLWAWGRNLENQIGDGLPFQRLTPSPMPLPQP